MKSPDKDVPVVFVNTLLGRGHMNGVVNLTFGTFQFTPTEDSIDSDLVLSARLRMDVVCAQQLYQSLGELFDAIEKEQAKALGAIPTEKPAKEAKPN
jgi:hypothetical protein